MVKKIFYWTSRFIFLIFSPFLVSDLEFVNVEIEEKDILGHEGQGFEIALATMGANRFAFAAAAAAFLRRLLGSHWSFLVSKSFIWSKLEKFSRLNPTLQRYEALGIRFERFKFN